MTDFSFGFKIVEKVYDVQWKHKRIFQGQVEKECAWCSEVIKIGDPKTTFSRQTKKGVSGVPGSSTWQTKHAHGHTSDRSSCAVEINKLLNSEVATTDLEKGITE